MDIHFYHVKPTLPKGSSVKVFPLLLVHGWPGSVVEFQKIIPLLTTPRAGQDFVFELIIPSLPGYGFSDAAVRPGLATTQVLEEIFSRNFTRESTRVLTVIIIFFFFVDVGGVKESDEQTRIRKILYSRWRLGKHNNHEYCNSLPRKVADGLITR